jgi:putative redox protein
MTRERRAEVILEGEGRFVARTGTGRSLVYGDMSESNEYSPFENVLASLAACSAMDVISIALKKRQDVVEYRVHVEGTQRDEYPQIFPEITVTHSVDGPDLSEAAIRRCIELSAAKYCPVNAMLSAGATVVHHRYVIHSTGKAPYDAEGEVIATGPYARPDVIPA